jgi:excisionase family DNA binding protein
VRVDVTAIARQPLVKLLLTPNEAAAALGIKRTKLYHLARTRQIDSVKIGTLRRFSIEALEAYIQRLGMAEKAG